LEQCVLNFNQCSFGPGTEVGLFGFFVAKEVTMPEPGDAVTSHQFDRLTSEFLDSQIAPG
jgi:hypothetical protein